MNIKGVVIAFFMVVLTMAGNALADIRDTYDYASSCPQSPNKTDKWGFATCNCTSYAADKMNEHDVHLNNYNWPKKGFHWGNAYEWIKAAQAAQAAKLAGITYNTSPKHRDIAWWPASDSTKWLGHVAYVESVDSKGNITVSEYNFEHKYDYGHGTRAIKKGSSSYPKYFIHFGAK